MIILAACANCANTRPPLRPPGRMSYAPTLGFPLGIYFACATNVESLRGLANLPVQRFTVANPRGRDSNAACTNTVSLRPLRSLRPIPRFRNGPVPTGPYFVTYVLLSMIISAACANFVARRSPLRTPRANHDSPLQPEFVLGFYFASLCVLCGHSSFLWLRRCRARLFVVNKTN